MHRLTRQLHRHRSCTVALPHLSSIGRLWHGGAGTEGTMAACRVLMVYPQFIPNSFLELHGSLQARRREVSGGPARPDHCRGAAAEGLGLPAGQPQHRGADRRRSRLGRSGDDRRHAQPAARLPLSDRARAPARQAGRASAGPTSSSSPHLYAAADFQVIGEAEHIMKDFIAAWERGERKGVFTAEKFKIDVTQSPLPRLRPAQARAVSLHRRAIFARLPVHLRVLRHHRAVRPRAAHQDQRPDPRRTAGAL